MNPQTLYDLSPLARMMLVGVVLALGPLVWVGWRMRHGARTPQLYALTLLTLFLTFDLVLFGAFTRLSDSGLGCPDWPGCYGSASPLGAEAQIAMAQSAMPTGPVTRSKAWVEMIHRYLATGVGVLILVLAVASWLAHMKNRAAGLRLQAPGSAWLASATLVWVCVQGAFGALTVTMKLFPAIVTLHLIGGLVLLALLTVQGVRQNQFQTAAAPARISPGVRRLIWVTFAALAVQIILGGWVSTNYAVLACNEFPRCQNSWWPEMDFAQGFQVWRKLGLTPQGENIGFAALTAIHYAHRLMAAVVLIAGAALAWVLNGVDGRVGGGGLRRQSRWIAGLIGLQLATGLSNVVFDWPLLAALLHTGGAGALVMVMTWTVCASSTRFERHNSQASQAGGSDRASMHTPTMNVQNP